MEHDLLHGVFVVLQVLFGSRYPVIEVVIEFGHFNYLVLEVGLNPHVVLLALVIQLDNSVVLLLVLGLLLVDVFKGVHLFNIDIQRVRGRLKHVLGSD